ncbi:MAG TPA: CHASE3 domain-containing protein, partial [Tepidisphaeraceae bacterium]
MPRPNQLRAVFLVVALVLIGGFIAAFLIGNVTLVNSAAVGRQHHAITVLQQLFSTVQDAETGQRGFLITGEDAYLEPYNSAIARVQRDLQEAQQLVGDAEIPADASRQLQDLVGRKLEEMKHTIEVR